MRTCAPYWRCKFFLTVVGISILFCFGGCNRGVPRGGEIHSGDLAPKFTLPDSAAREHSVKDFPAKLYLVNFWASWCVPCMEELPALQKLQNEYGPKGLQVIGVNLDAPTEQGKVLAIMKKSKLEFPVLFDTSYQAAKDFGITGFPESFLLDSQGRFVSLSVDGEVRTRVVGEIDWTGADVRNQLETLLGASS